MEGEKRMKYEKESIKRDVEDALEYVEKLEDCLKFIKNHIELGEIPGF